MSENKEKRCPDCWTRLTENQKICPRCGIDIEQAAKDRADAMKSDEKSLSTKIKHMSVRSKITSICILAVFVIGSVVGYGFSMQTKTDTATSLAEEYLVIADEAMKSIDELALEYENNVYNKDWILHIESAKEVREKNDEKIKTIKATREPMEYFQASIKNTEMDEFVKWSDKLFYSYQKSYAYVVGEVGKYPHYYDNFKKLLKEYQNARKNLKKLIK